MASSAESLLCSKAANHPTRQPPCRSLTIDLGEIFRLRYETYTLPSEPPLAPIWDEELELLDRILRSAREGGDEDVLGLTLQWIKPEDGAEKEKKAEERLMATCKTYSVQREITMIPKTGADRIEEANAIEAEEGKIGRLARSLRHDRLGYGFV